MLGFKGLGDVFVVCLSTGNAKGLGNVRKEEFERAMDIFGIWQGRRFILDHPYAVFIMLRHCLIISKGTCRTIRQLPGIPLS
jgi:LmbE family N-acetylglucosaminyl deacetylase